MKLQNHTIHNEEEYKTTKKTLAKQKRPSKILRVLMNALESYRQSKKYGWSRPWNKYNLVNFQSFKLDWKDDSFLLGELEAVLEFQFSDIPENAKRFCGELLADKSHLMGFIFVHEFDENGDKYEGVTLSLGKKNDNQFRDRLDVIFESPVSEGKSKGLGRIRLFVDPYQEKTKVLLYSSTAQASHQASSKLFASLADISWAWAGNENKLWDHWTSKYIDYFGDRSWKMNGSYFYHPDDQVSRLKAS